MKKFVLAFLLCLPSLLIAQKRESQLGLGAQVFYSDRLWLKNDGAWDSLSQGERGFAGIAPQLWFIQYINKYWTVQTGLGYSTYGFQRRSKNLEFNDKVHPDLPKVSTALYGDPSYYDFFFRNHRIDLPVLFNTEIISLRKTISLRYFFSPGISFSYTVWDKVVAKSRGFGYDGKNRFVVSNLYDKQAFGVQLHLAGRVEYRISPKYRAHLQPIINLPLTSVYKGENKALVPSVGVNFVLSLLTSKIDEKE